MKKCCLNCVFCIRCKDKVIWNGKQVYNDNERVNLNSEERERALNNDFDFIEEERRYQREWENTYNEKYSKLKRGEYFPRISGNLALQLLQNSSSSNDPFSLYSFFNMPPHPDAPNNDYLACWHDLWNFCNNDKDYNSLNKKNKCAFFYPYNEKGYKNLKGCEKDRINKLDKRRFYITNAFVILGIIVSIIGIIFTP